MSVHPVAGHRAMSRVPHPSSNTARRPAARLEDRIVDVLRLEALSASELSERVTLPAGKSFRTLLRELLQSGRIRSAIYGMEDVFLAGGVDPGPLLLARFPKVSDYALRLASAFRPGRLYRRLDLESVPGMSSVYTRLQPLLASGLIGATDTPRNTLFFLTSLGYSHPGYDALCAKAMPVDYCSFPHAQAGGGVLDCLAQGSLRGDQIQAYFYDGVEDGDLLHVLGFLRDRRYIGVDDAGLFSILPEGRDFLEKHRIRREETPEALVARWTREAIRREERGHWPSLSVSVR